MYKVIQKETNAEIVILEPVWAEQINVLRDWSERNVLVCQECQQPVRVRAGQIRIWHFAHKHRQDCPIGHESPRLLQARALLYRWLVRKFGSERVTLEKRVLGTALPRPVDCWVNGEPNFAYWIFEAGMKLQRREALHTALAQPNVEVHWLFLAVMLRPDKDDSEAIYLTKTERGFSRSSDYDIPIMPGGKTLHYLNEESGEITTYRGLHLRHAPQVYQGKPLCHPIDQVLASPKTGEFIHAGEYERLKAYREEKKKKEQITNQLTPLPLPRRPVAVTSPTEPALSPSISPHPVSQPENPSSVAEVNPAAICEYCGEETRDWWYYDGKTGRCRCRKCRQSRKEKK